MNRLIYIELYMLNLRKTYKEKEKPKFKIAGRQRITTKSVSRTKLKRDVLVMAKRKPAEFLQLATDENVHLRNIGIKAAEANIIKLSGDNRSFSWASNGRKLFTVPFNEHPYSALASWFKTDEGLEVFGAIEKKLK